ncbi:hypothetical protein BC832DRAFT_608224 [Gaertneriomyces semiglobifer]|nr:hypothetical protein BC832DRAFT_608224 [Gaertneriomyces semiglobifer]
MSHEPAGLPEEHPASHSTEELLSPEMQSTQVARQSLDQRRVAPEVSVVIDDKAGTLAASHDTRDAASVGSASGSVKSAVEHTKWYYRTSVFPHVWTTEVSVLWIVTSVVITLYALLYMGSAWDPQGRLPHLPVAFLEDDAGYTTMSSLSPTSQALVKSMTNDTSIGMRLAQAWMENPELKNRLQWTSITQDFKSRPDARDEAIRLVERGDYWGVLYIPKNISDNYLTNLNLGQTPSAQRQQMSVEYIWDNGRHYTISTYAFQVVSASLNAISHAFATQLAAGTSGSPALVKPEFYISPISLSSTKQHPVPVFGVNISSYIMLLLMWLSAMMSITVIYKLFLANIGRLTGVRPGPAASVLKKPRPISEEHRASSNANIKFPSFQIALATVSLGGIFAFTHALLAWGVLVGLGGLDIVVHGNAGALFGFLFYFSFSCLGFVALLCVAFGVDGFAVPASVLLILQLTSSTALASFETMPGVMRMGIAFPFYWGLKGTRAYLTGSQTHELSKCYWVLLGWGFGSVLLAILIATRKVKRWKRTERGGVVSGAVEGLAVLGGTLRQVG